MWLNIEGTPKFLYITFILIVIVLVLNWIYTEEIPIDITLLTTALNATSSLLNTTKDFEIHLPIPHSQYDGNQSGIDIKSNESSNGSNIHNGDKNQRQNYASLEGLIDSINNTQDTNVIKETNTNDIVTHDVHIFQLGLINVYNHIVWIF